jgi:hypothetical protein
MAGSRAAIIVPPMEIDLRIFFLVFVNKKTVAEFIYY